MLYFGNQAKSHIQETDYMIKKQNSLITLCFAAVLCLCISFSIAAYEREALDALRDAEQYEKEEDHYDAAEKYMAVELYASDPVPKANALIGAARNYRKAGFFGKELECLERLVDEHINRIDYARVVTRMYQIGDAFFDGHKDAAISWLPFIHDKNRMEDAYRLALKHAPSAPEAPVARLRLAIMRMDSRDPVSAVDELQAIMKLHPETDAARNAYIQLAYLYTKLAENGDGDGKWATLAAEQLDAFIEKYPDDRQIPWAKKQRELVDSINVKRLYGLAEYYHRKGNDEAAKGYLGQIIRDYGTSKDAIPAEKLLAEIDSTYTPPEKDAPRKPEYRIKIQQNTIPEERSRIMIVPENSDGRFLLPVRDLELNRVRDSRDTLPERTTTDEDI